MELLRSELRVVVTTERDVEYIPFAGRTAIIRTRVTLLLGDEEISSSEDTVRP